MSNQLREQAQRVMKACGVASVPLKAEMKAEKSALKLTQIAENKISKAVRKKYQSEEAMKEKGLMKHCWKRPKIEAVGGASVMSAKCRWKCRPEIFSISRIKACATYSEKQLKAVDSLCCNMYASIMKKDGSNLADIHYERNAVAFLVFRTSWGWNHWLCRLASPVVHCSAERRKAVTGLLYLSNVRGREALKREGVLQAVERS